MPADQTRTCLMCGVRISGRADKKYCSDQCRVTYNNRQIAPADRFARNVIHVLNRNRRILQSLNPSGKTTVTRAKLMTRGFNFGYYTNQYATREGAVYTFCFEQGYLEVETNRFLLVVKKVD